MSAPWSTDVDQFLALVLASGLVDQADLREACSDFQADRRKASALDALCRHLLSKETLTQWQCEKLRKGKWKGFFLHDYCLMGHLSVADKTSTYLARETGTGKLVAITITAPDLINYQVSELPNEGGIGDT